MKKNEIIKLLQEEKGRITMLIDSLLNCDDGCIHVIIILDGAIIPIGVTKDVYNKRVFDYDVILWSDIWLSYMMEAYGLGYNIEDEYNTIFNGISKELNSIPIEHAYSASGITNKVDASNLNRYLFKISEHGLFVPDSITFTTPLENHPDVLIACRK